MSVIINEFEMIADGAEKSAQPPAAPAAETMPKPKELAPKDLLAALEFEAKRFYRIWAH